MGLLVKTKLGELNLKDEDVIVFEEGVPGFEHLKRFVLVFPEETYPIGWLLSVEDEGVGLPVVDPRLVRVDYDPEIPQEDLEKLSVTGKEGLILLSVVTIPPGKPEDATVNLLAPILINPTIKKGRQVILYDQGYGLRHKISEELERSKAMV